MRRSLPPLLVPALLLAVFAPSLDAHDDPIFKSQQQAPFAGPMVVNPGAGSTVFQGSGVTLLSWLPLGDFGAQSSGADCWGYTSPSGREYAIMGLSDGVGFVEVTDPGAPVLLTTLAAVNSGWRDIKIYEDHAYYVSEGGDGIVVVDRSNIDSGVVNIVNQVTGPGTDATHNVAIDEDSGFLYRVGGGTSPIEGLRIYSLANKSNPAFVGEWDDRYIHDAQIVTYASGPFAGKQVAFCYSEDTAGGTNPAVDILDVTNKNNIQLISQLNYSGGVFSHQGWLSPDLNTLYLNDELDELSFGTLTTTRVADVSNLNNPVQVGSFTSGLTSVDHNLYTQGNLIYEANYRSGLRVFDATNPTSPVETAWFDTYPDDDAPSFNGLWNAYPYFASGTIIGSDIERGLFVLKLGDRSVDFAFPSGQAELIDPSGEVMPVTIAPQGGASITPGSETLHVDSGGGFTAIPLAWLGGNAYEGTFPAEACGTSVRYYLSARTTDGTTWTEPAGGPSVVYGAVAALTETILVSADFESNPGWDAGMPGDDATTGVWERVNPVGTEAAPENDHTDDPADMCFVTGQGLVGGGLGDDDVDDGITTLRTSTFDLSSGDATVKYWRWYSNVAGGDPNNDVFVIDISNDNGSSWTNVETVGPTGSDTLGGWIEHSFKVSDLVTPTSQMRMRFIAEDANSGSIVEAAIDDFEVVRYGCDPVCQTDVGFGGPGTAQFSICGASLDSGNVATLLLEQAPPNSPAVLFIGLVNNPAPFKGGMLVPLPALLDITFATDGTGQLSFPVAGGGGPVTVYAQFALPDPGQVLGVSISNALEIVVGP
ncbi:MAG: choice-of-anchor B family protein [Planctomycetota bacterium]|jgi:choice-of-anchor B domain-containing protein